MKIQSVDAYPIFDSRGMPTLEVEITLSNGAKGRGLVPSGASTGQFEAWELRDGDQRRFRGKSVHQAIANVQTAIATALDGHDALDQRAIDRTMIELDGTPNKRHLGANAILGVSMAAAKAAALAKGLPLFESLGAGSGNLLPLPEIQIIGGGAHANWRTDVQDFMVIASGATSYAETLEMTFNVYHAAGDLLRQRKQYFGLADEGGYWPVFPTNESVLEFLCKAILQAGYTPGREVSLSLDIAASDLYDTATGCYEFSLEKRQFTSAQFAALMIDWCEKYPIVSIEDPAADTDWDTWIRVNRAVGNRIQIIGDDLFTTNKKRIQDGIRRGVANSVLIKLNQIGTVTETIEAIHMTQAAGWLPVVSARSGETEDAFIAHLAVATNAGQLKVGSFARSERLVKWNEILRIQRQLGGRGRFEGASIFAKLAELPRDNRQT